MAKRSSIHPQTMRELIAYDPETGVLTWRARSPSMFTPKEQTPEHCCARWNRKHAGKPAFTTVSRKGYLTGHVFNIGLRSHHVAWAIMTGEWPSAHIDHIDGNPANNRWANLRQVPPVENSHNMKRSKANTSGRTGVARLGVRRWQAYINRRGCRRVSLGGFDTFEEAVAAREAAERAEGYHRNHGR